jgi:hypothetical protein
MADGHRELSGSFRSSTTGCPRVAAGCHAGRTPTMLTLLGRRPWAAVAASGHRGRPRAGWVTMSAVTAAPTTTRSLMVGVRLSPGHLSGASDRRHRISLARSAAQRPSGRNCRKRRTVNLPLAAVSTAHVADFEPVRSFSRTRGRPAGGAGAAPAAGRSGDAQDSPVTRSADEVRSGRRLGRVGR